MWRQRLVLHCCTMLYCCDCWVSRSLSCFAPSLRPYFVEAGIFGIRWLQLVGMLHCVQAIKIFSQFAGKLWALGSQLSATPSWTMPKIPGGYLWLYQQVQSKWCFMIVIQYSLNQPVELLEESHREVSSIVITVKCDKNCAPLSARNMALTFPQQWVHPWLLGDCRDWSIGHWFQSFSEATSIRWSTTDSFARRPSFFKRILIFLMHFGHNFGLSPFGHVLEDVTGPWLWNSLASSCLKLLAWSDKCNQCTGRFLSLTLRETSCSLSAWRSGWRAGPVERQQQQHAAVLCCQIAFICLYYLSI